MRSGKRRARRGAREVHTSVLVWLGVAAGLGSACNLLLGNQELDADGGLVDAQPGSDHHLGSDSPSDAGLDAKDAAADAPQDRRVGDTGAGSDGAVCGEHAPLIDGGTLQIKANFCNHISAPPGMIKFCEDFDESDGAVPEGDAWTEIADGGAVSLTEDAYVSPHHALHANAASVGGATAKAELKHSFVHADYADFEFDVRIGTVVANDASTTSIAIIEFDESGGDAHIDLEVTPSGLSFFQVVTDQASLLGDGGFSNPGDWIHVAMRIDLSSIRADMEVRDLCSGTLLWSASPSLNTVFTPVNSGDIGVGFTYLYLPGDETPQSVDFDNVTLFTGSDAG